MKGKYPPYPSEVVSDIRDMFLKSTEAFAARVALQYKENGCWIPITFRDLRILVEQLACGLGSLGLKPHESKLGILGDNRPEWAASYLAAACTAITCVPIDRDLKETEVFHILYLSGVETVVTDGKHVDMIREIRRKLPTLRHVICMDRVDGNDVLGFERVKELGRSRATVGIDDFACGMVSPDDVLSILFTSGTMGNSKGVMLTHANVVSNMKEAVEWVDLRTDDCFLSVLPMHHAYECTDGFLLALYRGASTAYAENLRRIPENLSETHATAMLGVPALWHAMYKRIQAGMEEKGMWKVTLAKKMAGLSQSVLGKDIRRKVFSAVHERFGGSLRIIISGGAAVDPDVARGFRELGIEFLQGYGLTESSPILTVNRNRAFKDESVGLPLPSVELRIAEDGEILARGPNIMKGYYNNPEATREALADGWLHTGDLGYIDEDGFLHIQGRKKAVIVTPGGKKIYPEEVEAEIMKSPYVLECLVWGDRTSDPTHDADVFCIVVPNTEYFVSQGVENSGAVDPSQVEEILRREVKKQCQNLAAFKRVTKLTIRHEEFEKTTTKKIKRYLYTGRASDLVGGK
jgi:long-chain acyl-CoA synthetase